MKKTATILLIISTLVITGMKTDSQAQNRRPLKNSVSLSLSGCALTGYQTLGLLPISFEYSRIFTDRMSYGAAFHYYETPGSTITCRYYEPNAAAASLFAKFNYDLPVAGYILFLRFGAGAGISYYRLMDHDWDYDRRKWDGGKLRPSLMVDINWRIRVSRRIDLFFAPLLISPSKFIFTPWGFDRCNTPYFSTDIMGKLGVAVNF